MVVGFWGGTATSTDGINWLVGNVPTPVPGDGLYGVAYGNGTYVTVGGAAGAADLNVFTSSDGQTWTAQHSTSPSGASLGDVARGASRFVAIGVKLDSGHAYTSSDGTNWTQRSIAGGSQVSFCHGLFLVPLGPGTNLISSDGLTWSAQHTGITNMLGKATYSQGAFLARAGAYLAASADGTNWAQYPQPLPGTSTVASDGQRLVTVGNNTSPFVPMYASGYTYVSDPLLGLRITAGRPPTIALSGLVGRTYRIEVTNALVSSGSNNWQAAASAQMTNNPWLWTDASATNVTARFYRGVLLP